MDEHVLRGNAAIVKCHIPSFVIDFVYVSAWILDDNNEIMEIFADQNGTDINTLGTWPTLEYLSTSSYSSFSLDFKCAVPFMNLKLMFFVENFRLRTLFRSQRLSVCLCFHFLFHGTIVPALECVNVVYRTYIDGERKRYQWQFVSLVEIPEKNILSYSKLYGLSMSRNSQYPHIWWNEL